MIQYPDCKKIDHVRARELRQALGLTMERMAQLLQCNMSSLVRWESKTGNEPTMIYGVLYTMLDRVDQEIPGGIAPIGQLHRTCGPVRAMGALFNLYSTLPSVIRGGL